MTFLLLSYNSIGASGYSALANALRCNFVLQSFYQNPNPSDAQISTYLARNQQCAGRSTPTLQCPAAIPDSAQAAFRRYVVEKAQVLLQPLNPQYATVAMKPEVKICGVVFLRYSVLDDNNTKH